MGPEEREICVLGWPKFDLKKYEFDFSCKK
jgi:hypothetical protein